MMQILKRLITEHGHFYSHKEQKAYELDLELRKEKILSYNFFLF
jgi:hypothetical protein